MNEQSTEEELVRFRAMCKTTGETECSGEEQLTQEHKSARGVPVLEWPVKRYLLNFKSVICRCKE